MDDDARNYLVIATTLPAAFDPAAFRDALGKCGTDVAVCMGNKEQLAMFLRTTSSALSINNTLARARLPGVRFWVIVELGREWYAHDTLPASRWLVGHLGPWRQ